MTARESTLAGRYRSLFVIGRGGMGSVEAALELGAEADYERVVALKRLLPDSARDARRTEMFLREAKLAAMLSHPNVVRAFDYGEADGQLYLAMEYVEGQPLSIVLRTVADAGESIDPALVAYLLAEACDGLHAAHELTSEGGQPLNLVHRDVSPQNVMLGYDGHVRLLDFGVAKIEAESVTKTGEVKGKAAYMSPEQAMGDLIDRRSDLYGVGAVLYECLVLRRMWGDGTDMEVIRKLALEEPPPLPDGVPEELRVLYRRLVARDAKDRPATAREVAEALRASAGATGEAALKDLLGRYFATQADTQRKQLEAALDEVAPDQAQELRESIVPTSSQTSAIADVARASGVRLEEPAAASARAGEATASASRGWAAPAVLAAAIVGVIAWRATSAPARKADGIEGGTGSTVTLTATATATTTATASASAPATATSPTTTPTTTTATPSATPSASATASAMVTVSARPPAPPRPSSSAAPAAKASAAPATSRPRLDIDDHPF